MSDIPDVDHGHCHIIVQYTIAAALLSFHYARFNFCFFKLLLCFLMLFTLSSFF